MLAVGLSADDGAEHVAATTESEEPPMRPSPEVRATMLDFYAQISASDVASFDRLVSTDPATLVIGTSPGEWVTERDRLRFGFEAEGLAIAPGPTPIGAQMHTRLTSILQRDEGTWRIVHMHVSVGVPDDEVVEHQARWLSA
jgi:hypothetical protein